MANKHLNFDLDFIDKKSEKLHIEKSHDGNKGEQKRDRGGNNWKTTLIVLGVIIGFIFLVFGSDSSSSNSPTDDSVAVGDYICSRSDASEADSIRPDSTIFDELESEQNDLDSEHAYLDEYDEFAVDDYNSKVDTYNTKKDEYNESVDRYNTFLVENCTKNTTSDSEGAE